VPCKLAGVSAWRQDDRLDPVPDKLREVVDIVLGDLQGHNPIDVQVGYEPSRGALWLSESGEQGTVGFRPEDMRGAELIVRFADYLQEQFFPETRGAWGEARPMCPRHSHPAVPVEVEGEAWWTCPDDGQKLAIIGAQRL
jgi:hypothetical protein